MRLTSPAPRADRAEIRALVEQFSARSKAARLHHDVRSARRLLAAFG